MSFTTPENTPDKSREAAAMVIQYLRSNFADALFFEDLSKNSSILITFPNINAEIVCNLLRQKGFSVTAECACEGSGNVTDIPFAQKIGAFWIDLSALTAVEEFAEKLNESLSVARKFTQS